MREVHAEVQRSLFLRMCGHSGSSGAVEYDRSAAGACELKRLLELGAVSKARASVPLCSSGDGGSTETSRKFWCLAPNQKQL